MTNVICRALTCLFWEQGVCGADEIEYQPDVGCLAFLDLGDLELSTEDEEDEEWEEEEEPASDDEDEEEGYEEEVQEWGDDEEM